MQPAAVLSPPDLVRVVRVYRAALGEHRAALNRLNVYPVPDGDTGTNMSLTLDAVLDEVDRASAPDGPEADCGHGLSLPVLANCLSHGSLMGARGNSGVILSQILRGMASTFAGASAGLGAPDIAEALSRASASAYAAVSNPVEGTILTVVRAGARAAEAAAREPASLAQVLESAREAAAAALAGTTEQLAVLRAAGVVDAGGAGLLLLFDSFLNVLTGREIPAPPAPPAPPGDGRGRPGAAPAPSAGAAAPGDIADLRYEVMFFLEAADETVPAFREVWAGCGASIVIVGADGLYNCHIHTDDVGAAIEAAIEIGRPRQIRVVDLAEQVGEERWVREAAASGDQHEPPAGAVACAVVAVCAGDGVRRIFRSLGARQIVAGGQSANPSTAEILEAIGCAPAEAVVVLPNNPNVVPVALQAAAHAAKKVRVVPTAGIAEGFAALLAYDPEADVDTNADNMAAAAARVVAGEVARASRDAPSGAGPVKAGDWLGLDRQGIKVVRPAAATAADAAIALLDGLVSEGDDHEVVTVIEGEGARAADTRRIVEWLSENRPGVSAEVHHGGQPLYPYLFSVE
ncbi:MAG: DAK2 domain-containing protein [Acidimicrobiales bacterium]